MLACPFFSFLSSSKSGFIGGLGTEASKASETTLRIPRLCGSLLFSLAFSFRLAVPALSEETGGWSALGRAAPFGKTGCRTAAGWTDGGGVVRAVGAGAQVKTQDVAVVLEALVGVGEDGVGFGDAHEAVGGVRV